MKGGVRLYISKKNSNFDENVFIKVIFYVKNEKRKMPARECGGSLFHHPSFVVSNEGFPVGELLSGAEGDTVLQMMTHGGG